jgi:hypothetical protein
MDSPGCPTAFERSGTSGRKGGLENYQPDIFSF